MKPLQSEARRRFVARLAALSGAWLPVGDGVRAASDASDIVLGQTFDARRAELALITRVQQAWFDRVNAAGGVRGRKVRLVTLDDGGDATRTRKNLHELAERHRALALFGMPSTAHAEVGAMPQLFVRDRLGAAPGAVAAAVTLGFYPSYEIEGALLARHALESAPGSRIAVQHGEDDVGRHLLAGLRRGLGDRADKLMVQVLPIGTDDALPEAQQAGGADVLVLAARPDLTLRALAATPAQGRALRRIIASESAAALPAAAPALRTKAVGVESVRYLLDAHDPGWSTRKPWHFAEFSRWDNDRGVQGYTRFIRAHVSGAEPKSEPVEYAYLTARLMVQLLGQCRDQLTRGDLSKQALRMALADAPLLSPGIRIYTHPDRSTPITQGQFMRFDGAHWAEFGEVIEADS